MRISKVFWLALLAFAVGGVLISACSSLPDSLPFAETAEA